MFTAVEAAKPPPEMTVVAPASPLDGVSVMKAGVLKVASAAAVPTLARVDTAGTKVASGAANIADTLLKSSAAVAT
jgi:hypothetical protein